MTVALTPEQIRSRLKFAEANAAHAPRWNIATTETDRVATLHLYGVVGGFWGDIDAGEVVRAIRAADVDEIRVYINSPGGDAYDGIAIRNALRGHAARIVVTVDGLAASAASLIATAGDDVVMGTGAEIMVHDAWIIAIGNADELRAAAADLDRLSDNVAAMYADKAGGTPAEWRAVMKAETWYSADEAVSAGLANRTEDDAPAARALARSFDLSMYEHAGRAHAPTPTTLHPVNQARNPRTEPANARERSTTMAETPTAQDLAEVRDSVEELERSFTAFQSRQDDRAPAADTRSAGAVLKALIEGDEATTRAYNRAQEFRNDERMRPGRPNDAYTGGTTADAPVKDAWVGDLTRIFDESSGVLADFFATGTLPKTGMNVEYAQLLDSTITVTEQEDEGDDLPIGKIRLETKTAPVRTYGGATQLSLQQIERSTLPVLNRTLEALAMEAGKRRKAALRTGISAAVAARKAIAANGGVVVLGAALGASVAGNWEDALIDAAIKFDAQSAPIERMFVSASVFKKLRSLTVAGERVFKVAKDNASGELDLPGLKGDFASLPVSLDPGQAGDEAYFANHRAVRQYISGIASLQDTNVINLSKDFSVYFYGAVAPEIPQFIVPIKLAAS